MVLPRLSGFRTTTNLGLYTILVVSAFVRIQPQPYIRTQVTWCLVIHGAGASLVEMRVDEMKAQVCHGSLLFLLQLLPLPH